MTNNYAIRDAFGEALKDLGKVNNDVVVLEADVGNSSKSILFGNEFPDRYFNVGIAELNMAAISAGLSLNGKIPFINCFAQFMTTRASDPICSLISYDNLNVKICSTYCGLSDSYDGASHQSLNDIAFARLLPNMTVISPCDATSTRKAVFKSAEIDGPVYIRISRASVPTIYNEDYEFVVGKGNVLREGSNATIVATGYMVQKSLEAAEILEKQGISVDVIDIHTIKPLDIDLIKQYAEKTKNIITVEEHNVCGGLGGAVAEALSNEPTIKIKSIGMQGFGESGDYEEILTRAGLDGKSIAEQVQQFIYTNDQKGGK